MYKETYPNMQSKMINITYEKFQNKSNVSYKCPQMLLDFLFLLANYFRVLKELTDVKQTYLQQKQYVSLCAN